MLGYKGQLIFKKMTSCQELRLLAAYFTYCLFITHNCNAIVIVVTIIKLLGARPTHFFMQQWYSNGCICSHWLTLQFTWNRLRHSRHHLFNDQRWIFIDQITILIMWCIITVVTSYVHAVFTLPKTL